MNDVSDSDSLSVLRELLHDAHTRERVLVRQRDVAVDALRVATGLLRDMSRSTLNRRIEAFLDAEMARTRRWPEDSETR